MVPVNGSGKPSIPPASPSQRHKGQCTRSVAVHPIRRAAMPTDRVQRPNQQEQTRYRQVNRCHHPSKLHEGRRWVELNREISRRANPLLFGGRRATADPGCGARGRRQGLARYPSSTRSPCGLEGAVEPEGLPARLRHPWAAARPGRASRSITPSRRLACGDLAGGPPPTGAPRSQVRQCRPSARSPDTLTAWRPRS